MFWKNWSWPARILCGAGLGLAVCVFLLPAFLPSRSNEGNHTSCQPNLKQIGLGLLQYTQDYDEHFPLVETGGSAFGWADALQPYVKSTQIFHCPLAGGNAQTDPKQSGYTDFPFNARMNGIWMGNIEHPASQITSLDGNDGQDTTDARYSFSQIPAQWRKDDLSPLFRHNGTANYLFADGHVKSVAPWRVQGTGDVVF